MRSWSLKPPNLVFFGGGEALLTVAKPRMAPAAMVGCASESLAATVLVVEFRTANISVVGKTN